jgi:hypothetical protein
MQWGAWETVVWPALTLNIASTGRCAVRTRHGGAVDRVASEKR